MATFLGILFLIICLLLIAVVLLQKGRGGGLGAAFGGAGSSAFGTRTGDVFTWITIVLTGLFLLLAIFTTFSYRPPTGTVATPRVDVEGPIESTTTVQISTSTMGARIAYTLDGSTPEEGDAKSGIVTVTVNPGQTLKYRAFRKDWQPSPVGQTTYEKGSPEEAEESEQPEQPTTAPVAG